MCLFLYLWCYRVLFMLRHLSRRERRPSQILTSTRKSSQRQEGAEEVVEVAVEVVRILAIRMIPLQTQEAAEREEEAQEAAVREAAARNIQEAAGVRLYHPLHPHPAHLLQAHRRIHNNERQHRLRRLSHACLQPKWKSPHRSG